MTDNRVLNNPPTPNKKQIDADNFLCYILEAKQASEALIIEEEGKEPIECMATEFWVTVGVDIMDIDANNEEFECCEYITDDSIYITYNNRTINISIF